MKLLSPAASEFIDKHFTALTYTSQTITEKEFENCTFEKCVFIECTFSECKFTDCIFTGCSISAAKPLNSSFNTVTYKDSKVMGFDWTKAKRIQSLVFEKCDVSYSNFSFLKLHNLKMTESTAHEVNFDEADLTGALFTGTDFSGAVFSNSNLTHADFRKAFNYGIDFKFNILKKAKFSLPEAASLLKSLDVILE